MSSVITPMMGPAAKIAVGSVTTGGAGSSASVTNVGTESDAVLNFVIPRGNPGAGGAAATVSVGTVATGAAGSSASVVNVGTNTEAVLNFTIPRGDQGAPATSKRIVTARADTGAAGSVTFNFVPAFPSIPIALPSMSSTNSREYWRITSLTASSVTVQAFTQNQSFLALLGIDILTAGTTPIVGRSIGIVAVEA